MVVTAGYFSASAPAMSLSDTLLNSFAAVAGPLAYNSCHIQAWYVKQCNSGSNSVTLSIASTGAPWAQIIAVEYSPGGTLDQASTNTGHGVANPFTSSSITTLYPAEWIVDCCYPQTAITIAAGSGYTSRISNKAAFEDAFQSSPGTYSATWTGWQNTSTENVANIIASFRMLDVTQNDLLLCGCG